MNQDNNNNNINNSTVQLNPDPNQLTSDYNVDRKLGGWAEDPYGHLDQVNPTQGYNQSQYRYFSQKTVALIYAQNPDPTFHQQQGAVSAYYAALLAAGVSLPNNTPEKTKMLCEVCNISCDTQDVLEIHLLGKKHKKNVENIRRPTSTNPCHINMNINSVRKKKVVHWCEVCKIGCDTAVVLDKHKLGKKHKENLEKLKGCPTNTNPCHRNANSNYAHKKTKVVHRCEVCKIACDTKVVLEKHKSGKKHKENLEKLRGLTSSSHDLATVARPPSFIPLPMSYSSGCPPVTPSYLPLPVSNSSSRPPVTPSFLPLPISNSSSINKPIIGPQETPERNLYRNARKTNKKKATVVEDLESKRIKVLNGGAAADAVRTCVYCNVVCNSATVFNFHIAGQKHAAMVNYLAASGGGASMI